MDWLDNYLDGLAQYKTTVSPSDTHIWGVKPNLNNQQKRMLFDAAAQSELEYRLIVQEARQAEINAGMGGSYDAGSAAKEGPVSPVAPSGIVVANTDAIVLTGLTGGYYSELNGTYLKQTNPSAFSRGGVEGQATGAVYFNSEYIGGNKNGAAIWYGSNAGGAVGWQITYYDDNAYLLGAVASADSTIVPSGGFSNPFSYTGTIALASTSSVLSYASTASITSDFLAFTLTKENVSEDGNLIYQFDGSYNTPPRPANYYGFSAWNYETGTGNRAILAFNTSATTYFSNQESVVPNISLSPNTWYLIKFTGGDADEGSIPPVPDEFSVNTSSGQSAGNIPRALWSPNITITAA